MDGRKRSKEDEGTVLKAWQIVRKVLLTCVRRYGGCWSRGLCWQRIQTKYLMRQVHVTLCVHFQPLLTNWAFGRGSMLIIGVVL